MPKLKIEDLEKITENVKRKMLTREGGGRVKIIVHMGTCGIVAGARDIMNEFLNEVEISNSKDIIIITSGCAGLCSREPMATIEIAGEAPVKYADLTKEKVKKIFSEHILGGHIVEEYALSIGSERLN
jgi:NADP-reducing hydrogenase subunit HndB